MRDLENRERKTPQEIRISVRGLVEFVLRHGDIDNRHKASPDNAMQEGGRIHRKNGGGVPGGGPFEIYASDK